MQSLADAAGINYAPNELGCNPSTITPTPARHCTVAEATAYMQYILTWAQGRIAAGKTPRHLNYWTANCYADGTGQLSSPIGLAQGGLAALPDPDFRIAQFQQWSDLLAVTTPTLTHAAVVEPVHRRRRGPVHVEQPDRSPLRRRGAP